MRVLRPGNLFTVLLACFAGIASAQAPAPAPLASKDCFAARREQISLKVGKGVGLVPSAPAAEKFRQDNEFWYLTGLDWPDAVLVITKEGSWIATAKGKEKPPAGFEGVIARDRLGVAVAQYEHSGVWVSSGREEFYSLPNVPGEKREFGDPMATFNARQSWITGLKKEFPAARWKSLQFRLSRMRLVKDAGEIAVLKKGAEATGRAMIASIRRVKPGMAEREFQRVLEQGYLDRGATWLAFPTIVGSGVNGTGVHYTDNAGTLGADEVVVVDTGTEIGMYACDLTRTFPAGGKFTTRQREVYEAVLAAQKAAIAAIRPGVTMMDLDRIARSVLDERGFRGRMPHMTCHWIGLGVHDAGEYMTPFEPGMVLTVEPGVYLPEEGIGVRIEDVLIVTDGEPENITDFVPRDPDELAALVGADLK